MYNVKQKDICTIVQKLMVMNVISVKAMIKAKNLTKDSLVFSLYFERIISYEVLR